MILFLVTEFIVLKSHKTPFTPGETILKWLILYGLPVFLQKILSVAKGSLCCLHKNKVTRLPSNGHQVTEGKPSCNGSHDYL